MGERVAHSDRQAFESPMRRHDRRFYRVTRAILNNDAEAEEALQDAYLAAYRHMRGLRGHSTLSTGLTRIVINEALQRRRKNKRDDVIVPFAGREIGEDTMATSADTAAETPERAAMRAQRQRLLERAIDDLPIAFRTVGGAKTELLFDKSVTEPSNKDLPAGAPAQQKMP